MGKWALPQSDEDVTDELGLSEKDYAEKREWQAKRKGARAAAVEKMREEKLALEEIQKLKKDDPEEYERRIGESERIRKQNEEQKKRARLHQAALDRESEKNKPQKEVDEEEGKMVERKRAARKRQGKEQTNYLPYALGGIFFLFVVMNVLNFFQKDDKKDEDKED